MRINSLCVNLCAITFAFALMVSSSKPAKAQAPVIHNSNFSIAEQSVDSKGHTVVIMKGTGDLPGVLTLVLSLDASGAITGGEWAWNVSYTAPLHPDALPDPTAADPDAAGGEQLIQKGTLSGTIHGGAATAANGQVGSISSLQLVIARGTLQFAGVTQGTGSVVGTHMDDRTNSTVYASLTF